MQIAMLTLDDGTTHGMQRDDPSTADAAVMEFFAAERQAIDGDASLKRIERITRLGSMFNHRLNIRIILDPFDAGNRQNYFSDVCNQIRALGRPIVAFVDPDIGVATEAMNSPSENHVTEGNLN